MMNRVTRRGLLGKGAAGAAVVAAAVALPAAVQAAESTQRYCCPCNPPKGIDGPDKAKGDAAWEVLMNSGPRVRAAAFAYDQESGWGWLTEYAMMTAAFAKHFPGFELAVQRIADHVIDDSIISQGCDCFE